MNEKTKVTDFVSAEIVNRDKSKPIEEWECGHCGFITKTEALLDDHMKACAKNPYIGQDDVEYTTEVTQKDMIIVSWKTKKS